MTRLLSVLVSAGLLLVIYLRVEPGRLVRVLGESDSAWLALSLAMVVPVTLLTVWRFQLLMPRALRLGLGEASRLILAASVLNMVLPSKLGDLAKAYVLSERRRLDAPLALSLVVLERACDLLSLLSWCLLGLALHPREDPIFWIATVAVGLGLVVGGLLLGSPTVAGAAVRLGQTLLPRHAAAWLGRTGSSWARLLAYLRAEPRRLVAVGATSLALWLLHLVQIWFFVFALNAAVPLLAHLGLASLAILAGLLPLTFAGVGTRDAALIVLYRPFLGAPAGAALGILCTLRYLMPGIAGLPFVGEFRGALERARGTASRERESFTRSGPDATGSRQ